MLRGHNITIEVFQNNEKNYLIKDLFGITIGRITLIENLKESKFCSMRIKIYKEGDALSNYLKDVISLFTHYLISDKGFRKVDILVPEDMDLKPFIDLGFSFEGIISSSLLIENTYLDEFIFGLSSENYGTNLVNVIRLKGDRIELKILIPSDAEAMYQYYNKNRKYLQPFEPLRTELFYTEESQKRIIIDSYKQYLNGESMNFGIFKDNRLIGKINISNIVLGIFKSAFIGYSMDEDEQNKGYMKEAVELIKNYAFKELRLHRLEATTLLDNVKSQSVLKRCGFIEQGISKAYLFINGEWRDHIIFYCTNDLEV